MKKILLLLSLTLVATVVKAQQTTYSQELLYRPYGDNLMVVPVITNADGSQIIGDYKGAMVIPETVEGKTVVAIDAFTFKNCTELTEITIPSTVTLSGKQAFYGCSSLKKLTLEDSDEEIVFVHDVDDYQTARYWEFAALEEVYVGRNFRHVNLNGEQGDPFSEPFSYHPSLKSVVFGEKVTRINEGAFGWIHTLETVSFGAGLVTIEKDAFQGSELLSSSLHFPSTLKFIGEYAFYGTSVPEVIIPNSVDEICHYALSIGTLKYVVFEDGETPIRLGVGNMDGVAPGPFGTPMFSSGGRQILEEAYIGRPVESEWPNLFYGNATIKKVTLGDNAIGLSDSYFAYCENLETVVLGKNINRVGDNAFGGCKKLKTLNLPEGITYIGNSAFAGCESLTDIKLPSTLSYIGAYAFTNMGLNEIIIPQSVEEIGEYGVSNGALQRILIEDGDYPLTMLHADGSVFMNCNQIEEAYVGRDINTDIFHGNESLKTIIFGDKVTSINASFCENAPLETIVIGSSVMSIGEKAFAALWEDSSKLKEIFSRAANPPSCGEETFLNVNKQDCKLNVPGATVEAYKTADGWKDFFNVDPIADINDDRESNVTDVVTLISCIAKNDFTSISRETADVNGDGEVNVTDVVTLILMIATTK